MKLTAIFLLFACLHVTARTTGQNVTLSVKDAPMKQVFKEIQKQTGMSILVEESVLEKAGKVTLQVKNMPIDNVLTLCFKNEPLNFTIINGAIIIKKSEIIQPAATSKHALSSFFPPPPIDIHGKVVNESGEPFPGVTVTVKGTRIATSTDANGQFLLKGIDLNVTLVFTGINLETFELKVNGKTNLTVNIKTRISKLDEVQIIAYGQTSQRLNTGNVSTVKAADIQKQPVSNPLLALQGRVPGIQITQNTGVPGGGITVRIQGQNSLQAGNTPLYVIDGVPYTGHLLYNLSGTFGILGYNGEPTNPISPVGGGNPLSFINPADIESIDVLKDADATSIYGSQAAQGAILITTKKAKAGQTRVDINIQNGWGRVASKLKLLNTRQYLDMRREAYANDGTTPNINNAPDLLLWDTTRYTDWQKELIGGTAHYTDVQASVSGGTALTSFLISGNYHRETSVFPGNLADIKGSTHFNFNHASQNQKFKMQFSGNYMVDNNRLIVNDLTEAAVRLSPNAPALYNPDGSINWALRPNGTSSWYNPMAFYLEKKYFLKTSNLISNVLVGYEVLPGLELKTSLGYTNLQSNETMTFPLKSVAPQNRAFSNRFGIYGNNNINSWITEPQLTYKGRISGLKLEALVGATVLQRNSTSVQTYGNNYPSDEVIEDINSAASIGMYWNTVNNIYKYNAVFGRLNANWKDRYILNLTGRRDGSSRFGHESQFNNFTSVSGVWIFSNESFTQQAMPFLSFGKLRASYGTTGSDQIGDYQFMNLYRSYNVSAAYQGSSSLESTGLPNPYLEWEETQKLQVGLDLGFFKDRITINTNYYRNLSSNQLSQYALPAMVGRSSIQLNFPAEIENTGWEFSVNTRNISGKAISWNSHFNLTLPKNRLKSFPDLEKSSYAGAYIIGEPVSVSMAFAFAGVNPSTGLYQFKAANGTLTPTPDYTTDRTVIYHTNPKFYGGFQNNFRYHNFDLDILFQFVKQLGRNYLFGVSPGRFRSDDIILGNQPEYVMNRWQKSGDNSTHQKFSASYPSAIRTPFNNATSSDAVISDASFIRLKNISLSYHLPKQWQDKARLKNARLYMQGQNLWTITNFNGLDPESFGTTSLPPLRVITFGLQVAL